MKIIYSILICLFLSLKGNSQNSFRAVYQLEFLGKNEISMDIDNIKIHDSIKNPRYRNILMKLRKDFVRGVIAAEDIFFNLDFNKQVALFYLPDDVGLESEDLFYFKRMSNYRGKYFSNMKKNIHENNAFGEVFLIDIGSYDWKILSISKKIGKYLCYKANASIDIYNVKGHAKREVTAWFTPEIPYNFGPKGFNGLPGLIIELREGKLQYNLRKIESNNKEKIIEPKKGKEVTMKDFHVLSKKLYKNLKK